MFHQETLLLAVALTFCRAYVADKNSLHVPKAVLRLARSLNTADNAIPEPYESYGQQNYKCISEGRFEDPNDCGQYYDCIQTDTGELVAHKKSCFGHGFDTTIKACTQTDMVKGCSPSPTESLRSFTFADPTLLKVCKDLKNEFMCSDCKTLVMCVNSRAYSVPCGQGLLCSSNKTAFTGGVCYPGAPSECTCNKDNAFRKDIYNPSKFLSCDTLGSDPEIHTCPHGSVFNEELCTCGTHADSTCSITGSFAMMSNCNKYYTCILTTTGWLQKDFSCTNSSQMFNDKTGVCEDPCDWYTGHFECNQEGRFANPGDCKTFYDCIKDPLEIGNFIQVEHRCPEGYEWGPIANRSFCVTSSTTTEKCVPSKPINCKIPSGRCSATTDADVCDPHCVHGTCTARVMAAPHRHAAPNTCSCDAGWDGVQCNNPVCVGDSVSFGSKQLCISNINDKQNWTEANNACTAFGAGRLVTQFDPTGFMNFVNTSHSGNEFWVGGSEAETDGDWFWLDGESFWEDGDSVGSFPWYYDVPYTYDGDCLEMDLDPYVSPYSYLGYLVRECSTEFRYICEAGPF